MEQTLYDLMDWAGIEELTSRPILTGCWGRILRTRGF